MECDNATLVLNVSRTTQDVLIHLLMQKIREFHSASKFVSQLPLHRCSKELLVENQIWSEVRFCAFISMREKIHIYALTYQDYTLAEIISTKPETRKR